MQPHKTVFRKRVIEWLKRGVAEIRQECSARLRRRFGIILGTKSCINNSTIDTVEAKYFMNESVLVHDNYQVKVISAKTVDYIEYLSKKGTDTKTSSSGNYIEVELNISKLIDSNEKDHLLDINDFKLRNHSGVYIPLNTIMSFFDIDAVDVHIDTDENGFVKSSADFDNKNAIKDYTWVDSVIKNGENKNITLYFYLPEGYKVEESLMLLEVDLYWGKGGIKKGEDIVLLNCKRE